MARSSRSLRQKRPSRKRKINRTPKRRKSVRGGSRLPTESECLTLFESKKPNAGVSARYSYCKHWLSRKMYLDEAQKRYGKDYAHYSFVPRKLFGRRYDDGSGKCKVCGRAETRESSDLPEIGFAPTSSPPTPSDAGTRPPEAPPLPPLFIPPPVWKKLATASRKPGLGLQASVINEIVSKGRSGLRKIDQKEQRVVSSTEPEKGLVQARSNLKDWRKR